MRAGDEEMRAGFAVDVLVHIRTSREMVTGLRPKITTEANAILPDQLKIHNTGGSFTCIPKLQISSTDGC